MAVRPKIKRAADPLGIAPSSAVQKRWFWQIEGSDVAHEFQIELGSTVQRRQNWFWIEFEFTLRSSVNRVSTELQLDQDQLVPGSSVRHVWIGEDSPLFPKEAPPLARGGPIGG